MWAERQALAATFRPRARGTGRILCYHSVGQPDWGVNDVPPALFRRQLEMARQAGNRFVDAGQLAGGDADPRDLAITFDDGLTSVMTQAAPILAELGIPWSVFVVSEWADGGGGFDEGTFLRWRDLERLAGVAEIGSHSATHPDFGRIGTSQIERELRESREAIESRLGIRVRSFAIPFGQSTNWTGAAQAAALAAGYELVYAQAEETRPLGTVARTFVTRFDEPRIFRALLAGAFDRWEEWA